eukprot:gb/GECH01012653.1/.p1 GENE.gb/GECH01012653.1/~~gb/GECH01012653.1/.p1  ORF type:complete len:194 (+),score=32.16 gb/GECH01012653.1/:1-582(+)
MPEYKLVVVGAGGVGKTALTVQFTQQVFEDEYNPTIEDTYRKDVMIDDITYTMNILDTAGQEEYAVLRDQYWRTGDGFLLVYDITNPNSFDEIHTFYEQICRAKDVEYYPIVLVANKSDLEDQRAVSATEGKDLAKKNGWPFFETSAKRRINVEESFNSLVRFIRDYDEQAEEEGDDKKGKKSKKIKWKFWKK